MRFEIDKEAAQALYPALRSAYKNPLQAGYDGNGEPEWVGLCELYHATVEVMRQPDPDPAQCQCAKCVTCGECSVCDSAKGCPDCNGPNADHQLI